MKQEYFINYGEDPKFVFIQFFHHPKLASDSMAAIRDGQEIPENYQPMSWRFPTGIYVVRSFFLPTMSRFVICSSQTIVHKMHKHNKRNSVSNYVMMADNGKGPVHHYAFTGCKIELKHILRVIGNSTKLKVQSVSVNQLKEFHVSQKHEICLGH